MRQLKTVGEKEISILQLKKVERKEKVLLRLKKDWQLYVLLCPTLIYLFIFNYMPIYGIQIAFKNFAAVKGIAGSPWVGLRQFHDFFSSPYWSDLIINTFMLNLGSLIFAFPIPIILAIMLNQSASVRFKAFIQTITYTPHFISVVVLAGMMYIFLSPTSGVINKIIAAFGFQPIYFMAEKHWFRPVYIISGIWQGAGWSTILYIAALSGIDTQLYEAATIDGASKWRKIISIDIPSLIPVIITVLILNCGHLLSSEFQKTYLLQTPGNMAVSDTLGVYVYKVGLQGAQFSYSAAIGLLMNVVNFIMLILVNSISKKLSETSLW